MIFGQEVQTAGVVSTSDDMGKPERQQSGPVPGHAAEH